MIESFEVLKPSAHPQIRQITQIGEFETTNPARGTVLKEFI
jgi:hypothetical protein